MIHLIAAVDKNMVIGKGLDIPWHLPDDFKHFKATTNGYPIIMGATTWDSLPRKPLPNRRNIILSRTRSEADGEWFSSLEAALADIEGDCFVIGGAAVYEQALPLADELIISHVEMETDGDVFFPEIGPEWECYKETLYMGFAVKYYRKSGCDFL